MRSLLLGGLLAVCVAGVTDAQRVEWQGGAVAVFTGTEFVGGGVGVGWRLSGRMRLGLAAALGEASDRVAGRVEAALGYHANPFTRGLSPYVGGGLAVIAREGGTVEYLTAYLGVEANPRGRWGWFGEIGVSGGVRAAAGVRWRMAGLP